MTVSNPAFNDYPATSWLAKERTVAPAGFNRWLVPPAALAIHLCIGMAYGFSVFWLPLSRAVGIREPLACPPGTSFLHEMFVVSCDWRDKAQLTSIAAVAAGFTALLSLFNIAGRFFWASLSDKLGRKLTYVVFFAVGMALYASIPVSAAAGSKLAFVAACCVIVSMYGGGFATVPAYLADLFGTQMVGAIHGRLLTAWATAGIIGPVVVNYMREYQLGLGLPRSQVYNQTMYILVGMLALGLVCNLLIRPVAPKWFMNDAELAEERRLAHERALEGEVTAQGTDAAARTSPLLLAAAWAAVGIPLAWGIYRTLLSVGSFF